MTLLTNWRQIFAFLTSSTFAPSCLCFVFATCLPARFAACRRVHWLRLLFFFFCFFHLHLHLIAAVFSFLLRQRWAARDDSANLTCQITREEKAVSVSLSLPDCLFVCLPDCVCMFAKWCLVYRHMSRVRLTHLNFSMLGTAACPGCWWSATEYRLLVLQQHRFAAAAAATASHLSVVLAKTTWPYHISLISSSNNSNIIFFSFNFSIPPLFSLLLPLASPNYRCQVTSVLVQC